MILLAASDVVRAARFFPVPRERVYRAWTHPDEFKQWWRPGSFVTTSVELDARPGGAYAITMQDAQGRVQRLFGTFVEIMPPERLVMTWQLEGSEHEDGYEALLTVEFRSKGEGTEVVLVHERLRAAALANFEAGWKSVLDYLGRHLATA